MLKEHFGVNELGNLTIGGLDSVELAGRFGTPLYVMDEERIRENYRRFYRAFADRWPSVMVCYAYKANSNLAACKILQSEGAGAEVSSINELKMARFVGVPGERMVFNGNNKTREELELAVAEGVLINVDSLQELEAVGLIANAVGRVARISFRVNPDIEAPTHPHVATGLRESKFGLDIASGQALEAYRKAMAMGHVEILGIHSHIGSQILDPSPFEEEATKLLELVAQLKEELGLELELVDFGGGLGIPYKPGEQELPPERLAERIVGVVDRAVKGRGLRKPMLVFEPGRYIVADAGVLLVRVGYCKSRPRMPDWVAVDAGINALIRPALYDAYHHIEVASRMKEEHTELVNVGGPLCEAGDVLGKERLLPKIESGDLMAIFDVGAYGLAMSSQHTAQPRPAMVLVKEGKAEIVRERESYDDLTRLDRIPSWLM